MTMGYIFNAALYCKECGDAIKASITATDKGDSDTFPQECDVAAESDCPQHCDKCGGFLENQLTPYGYQYVANALVKGGETDILAVWREYYQGDTELF
jgi:hypothetical protein